MSGWNSWRGFEIKLAEDSCEYYAVIDDATVFYDRMNLLSKEDAEDNLYEGMQQSVECQIIL